MSAYALGMLLFVGCGGSADSRDARQPQPPPEESPGPTADAGSGGEPGSPDAGGITEPPPGGDAGADGGTSQVPDASTPDAGPPGGGDGGSDAGTPAGGDGGSDAGTPGGDGGTDGGTSTPDAGVPPVTGGPAQHGRQWRASYYAGVSPGGLTVADFNGDGSPDVAVNDEGAGFHSEYKARPGHFVVLLNDGKGALRKPVWRKELHSSSGRIASGHADTNGSVDVVLGTRFGAMLFTGRGDGTFADEPIRLASGFITSLGFWPGNATTPPHTWAIGGSIYNEGDAPRTDSGFGLLVPAEGGTFASRPFTHAGGEPVISWLNDEAVATVSDFGRDGRLDVVLTSSRWPLSRFSENASGTYDDWLLADRRPDLLATADLNVDGLDDLVAVDGQELWTYLGRADGSFSTGPMTAIPTRTRQLVVTDANADGRPDVVLVHREAGQVSLWWGNGAGGFEGPQVLATGREPSDAALADLDRDGTAELLVAEAGDNVVSVYTVPRAPHTEAPIAPRCPMVLQDALAERPAPEPLVTLTLNTGKVSAWLEPVAVGDFDGNGHNDFAVRTYEAHVRLLLGDGMGRFEVREVLQDANVHNVAAGDFSGDGRPDLATLTWQGLQLWRNDGHGGFPEGTTVPVWADEGGFLVPGDFNGDGRLDLAASIDTPCVTRGLLLTNQGGGEMAVSFLPDYNIEPDDQCAGSAPPIAADFNGDGTADLIHRTMALNLNYTSKEGTVVAGEGFYPRWTYGAGSAGDVDGDGKADLVLSASGTAMSVLRGDTGGTFESELSCSLKAAGRAPLEAMDVNGDGVVDLVGRDPDGAVVVVKGEGEGRYAPVVRYPLEGRPVWAAPVDVLGDAKPELVVLTASGALKVFPTP